MATVQPIIVVEDGEADARKHAPPPTVVDLTGQSDHTSDDEEYESDQSQERWGTESIYDELLEADFDLEDGPASESPDRCTAEESRYFKLLLRTVGADQFIRQTYERGMSIRKLCSVFFAGPSQMLDSMPDTGIFELLGRLMNRELSQRYKLPQYNTVDDAVQLLKTRKNIVVITGAGISTSLGIPDFRSKDTGFYAQLGPLGLSEPQEVFDLHIFQGDPTIFYSVAKGILPSTKKFSPTHAFIRLVQDKGKLLTNYTQNIDNLEEAAGILPEKLIQCHGSFATATCQDCGYKVKGDEIFEDIRACRVPRCVVCSRRIQQLRPAGMKRKRSSNGLASKKKRDEFEDSTDEEDDYQIAEAGVMKPDITFFGEALSEEFHDRIGKHDRDIVDLVIVIGTKLSVAPVAEIPLRIPKSVPQIFISRESCDHIAFDIELLGDCDDVVAELCRRAGWELEHEMIPKRTRRVEIGLDSNFPSRTSVKYLPVESECAAESSKAPEPANPTVGSAFGAATDAAAAGVLNIPGGIKL